MSFEPDTPFLGIHPNRSKTQVQKDTRTEWLCSMAQRGKNVETKLMPIRGKSWVHDDTPHFTWGPHTTFREWIRATPHDFHRVLVIKGKVYRMYVRRSHLVKKYNRSPKSKIKDSTRNLTSVFASWIAVNNSSFLNFSFLLCKIGVIKMHTS